MEDCVEKEKEIRETIADLFLKLNNHLNLLQSSTSTDSDHFQVTLNGNNSGATTIIHRNDSEGESGCHHCINIYVNNNVQGVNNSILLGSEVTMRDPGVYLSLPLPHNIDEKKGDEPQFEKRKKGRKTTWPGDYGFGAVLFCVISLLLMLFFFLT